MTPVGNVENDEQLLDHFRNWLLKTRQEAAEVEEAAGDAPAPRFGLDRLVEEFTALRHEIKLQTRGARSLEEKLEAALPPLAEAAAALRSAAARETAGAAEATEKGYALTLAELDEALERGRDQWRKNSARLTSATDLASRMDELHARQSWWQRRLTTDYHERIRQAVAHAEETARGERQALLTALLSGYDMILQRLARTMANAGVARIPTAGKPVDPERMVVVEVLDEPGNPGHVFEEVRPGYTWKGAVLRPAEVRAIRPRFEASIPGDSTAFRPDGE
jgi:molecular chaperone GrpE